MATWRFGDWCEQYGVALERVEPMVVAAYVEELKRKLAPAEREAALGGNPDAVRPAGRGPGPAVQPGELGTGPEVCREERQDAGTLRGRCEEAPGQD